MKRFAARLQGFTRFLFAIGLAATATAWAQNLPIVSGEPVVGTPKAAQTLGLLTTEEEMPARRLRLAAPSRAELSFADKADAAAKRVKIGFGREVAVHAVEGTGDKLAWSSVGEWRIAKLRVQSPGAASLRVGLRIGATRQPWVLRVAGSDDESKSLGPLRMAGPLGQAETYWTPLTEGDAQVIEIASPASQPEPFVQVATVSHVVASPSSQFRKTASDIGRSETCNIDVACVSNPPQGLLNAANAVVHMLATKPSGGSFLCTGTLLVDLHPGDQIPYLLSANHCFEADSAPYYTAQQMQQVASSLNTFFFFSAATCNSLATPPYVQRFNGATYLHHSLSQDVLFLRLNEWAPAGAFLAGWDANPVPIGTSITVLHHPYGDLKKYTSGTVRALETLSSPLNAPTGYWRAEYNQGITEPGSSGSALLSFSSTTGQYHVRGTLSYGNIFVCSSRQTNGYYVGNDWYSRFDVAYADVRQWLEATSLPDFDVTDLWFDPSESGWGMNLTQHPSGNVFGVWYTYAADSGPLWLVMTGGSWVTSRTFTGALYRTSGPGYNQPTFDPARVKLNPVGSITLNFSDANTGSFTWVVDGVQGTKAIIRQGF